MISQNWSHLWAYCSPAMLDSRGLLFSWHPEDSSASVCLWIWNFNLHGCWEARPTVTNSRGRGEVREPQREVPGGGHCGLCLLVPVTATWSLAVHHAAPASTSGWGLVGPWYQGLTGVCVLPWDATPPSTALITLLWPGSPARKLKFWFIVMKMSVGFGPPKLSRVCLPSLPGSARNQLWASLFEGLVPAPLASSRIFSTAALVHCGSGSEVL